MFRRFLAACAIVAILSTQVFPQNETTESGPPSRITDIPTDVLELSLDPMTVEELENEVEEWMASVKEVATQIADKEIGLIHGKGDRDLIGAELRELREAKAAMITRTQLVLSAYERKGGEISKQLKYIAAVRGIKAADTDVGARVQAIRSWMTASNGGKEFLLNVLKFIGILSIFWALSVFVGRIINRAIQNQAHISALLKAFIKKMARRVIVVIGIIVALSTVGVNVGAALALIGGASFILAFALQDSLSNFAAGIMLLIYRPFDVGDAVEIGGIKGKVDSVSMVSTTILTFDNQKVLVPNKKVWGETITNITGMTTRRVDLIFGIGYSDDIAKAQEIIEQVVAGHPLVLQEPIANIGVHELADSSVNFRCWAWTATDDYLTVRTEITRRVKEEFDAAGISIPFPQRDVHLHTVKSKGEDA